MQDLGVETVYGGIMSAYLSLDSPAPLERKVGSLQVSGFSVVRNAIRYDYPFIESLRSLLPLVDELILAVGDCDDGTVEALAAIDSPKLKIFHTVWDPAVRSGGLIISQQTNLALDQCQGDWCFYLPTTWCCTNWIYRPGSYINRPSISIDTFRYHHFRADYGFRDPLPIVDRRASFAATAARGATGMAVVFAKRANA